MKLLATIKSYAVKSLLQKRNYLVLLLMLVSASIAYAQKWKALDTEDLYAEAREQAFNGDRAEARLMLLHILNSKPNYTEVKVLLARTYAWDDQYEAATQLLLPILAEEPQNLEAIAAITDTYLWSEAYTEALQTVNLGLAIAPNEEALLLKKARIQNNLKNYTAANQTLDILLMINPAMQEAINLRASIVQASLIYSLGLQAGIELYDVVFDPATNGSVQLSRRNNWGSSIVRLNYAHRFQTNGLQGEVDFYPTFKRGYFGYLNYGYADNILFPNHRIGAEMYKNLPKSLEASLGIRYLYFDTNSDVMIYTGSLSWYHKSYWFSFRPYITPEKNVGTSVSLGLNARKYFANPLNYIGISGRIGYSPDRLIQNIGSDAIYTLKAQTIVLEYQHQLSGRWQLGANANYTRQELAFDTGSYVNILGLSATLTYKFKWKQ